jgi:hypothetical protein
MWNGGNLNLENTHSHFSSGVTASKNRESEGNPGKKIQFGADALFTINSQNKASITKENEIVFFSFQQTQQPLAAAPV